MTEISRPAIGKSSSAESSSRAKICELLFKTSIFLCQTVTQDKRKSQNLKIKPASVTKTLFACSFACQKPRVPRT